ncbi:ESX secretion-associated protein EspG [Rhodococcoides kroppenstedtii]|uniref:ESX secretion-associated protein EspG n=1 Tax=Rhodococcoides kroppenstedtii TaxID=293050 RepID=UPI001427AB67|nr:ESX secretion-associated protein EspG [Rhodococcus kroppenstedtii]
MTARVFSPLAFEVLSAVVGRTRPPFPIVTAADDTVTDTAALAGRRRDALRTLAGVDVVTAAATMDSTARHLTVCGVHVDGTRLRLRAAVRDTGAGAVLVVQQPDGVVTVDELSATALPSAVVGAIGGRAGDLPAATADRVAIEASSSAVRDRDDAATRVRSVLALPRTGIGDVVVGRLGDDPDGPLAADRSVRWIDTARGRYLLTSTATTLTVQPASPAATVALVRHLLTGPDREDDAVSPAPGGVRG